MSILQLASNFNIKIIERLQNKKLRVITKNDTFWYWLILSKLSGNRHFYH